MAARRHDMNANQLFKWCGGVAPKEPNEKAEIVSIEIVPEPELSPRRHRMERSGFIEIEFGNEARICIRGEVAAKTLRQVIELLR